MKSKEQVYIHIKNEETRKKAVEVLIKHNQVISPENPELSDYNENEYLKFNTEANCWVTSDYKTNLKETTISVLDIILSPNESEIKLPSRPVEKSILQEAEEIINGSRAEDYGSVTENFTKIAVGWKEIFADGNFTPRRVALAMVWLKICRDVNTPKRDNLVDSIGYVACVEKMINEAN